jgi:hypothetical protein
VEPRTATQGLSLYPGADPALLGQLSLPPADDLLLGGIVDVKKDGLAYSRQWDNVTDPANPQWVWVPALTAGLQITSIIPDKAIYGPGEPLLTVHVYGSDFTATTVVRVDGTDAPTTYISPTELTFVMNPQVPVTEQFHIITVYDTASTPPEGLGAEQFDFFKATTEVDYGTGLSLDTAPTPPIVHLQPAADSPSGLGGVYVVERTRTAIQGLELNGDGELKAPLATPLLAGTIVEPVADAKGYVRTTQLDGTSQWVPPAPSETLIAGNAPKDLGSVYVPARNKHNQGLNLDTGDGALYAPPATHEHLGTIVEPPEEDKQYARRRDPATHNNEWVEIAATDIAGNVPADVGVVFVPARNKTSQGLDLNPDGGLYAPPATHEHLGTIVEPLNDAKTYARKTEAGNSSWVETKSAEPAGNVPADIGVVFVPARNKTSQGLNLAGDGGLYAPPATHEHLGTILEPIPDAKGYVRTTQLDGTSQWVPPAPSETLIAGNAPADLGSVFVPARNKTSQGLDLNPDGGLYAPPATNEHLGTILDPPPDDKQYARKRSLVGNSAWVEIDNSGGINDVEQLPVGETYVRSYGRWMPTDRNVGAQPRKVNVGGDTMTGLLILSGDPVDEYGAVPRHMLNDLKLYVDAQDTADRLWVETYYADKPPAGGPYWMLNGAWSNIPAGVDATYGIGIDLNGSVVNLQPPKASPLEIGGVYTTPRSERNAVVIDTAGHINVPPATNQLLGGMLEPVADGKGYVRASQPDGSYQWVPPASAGAAYDFGIGITVDTTTTPNHTVSLEPAGIGSPAELGGIFVVPARGLSVNVDGGMVLVPATPDQIGGMLDSPWEIGKQYARENGQWVPTSGSGGLTISDTPPANPKHEDMWWESDSGDLFVYYVDPSGPPGQWVEAVAGAEPGMKVHVGDEPPTSANPADLWWDSDAGTLAIYYQDVDSTQWVQIAGGSSGSAGIDEAPIDGTPYNRQDSTWVAAAAGGGLPDAPNDGVQYTRGAPAAGGVNAWTPSTAATGAFLPLTGGTVTGAMNVAEGPLTLTKTSAVPGADTAGAYLVLNRTDPAQGVGFIAQNAGVESWKMTLSSGEITGIPGYGDKIQFVRSNAVQFEIDASGNTVISGNLTIYGTFTDALAADMPESAAAGGGTDVSKTLSVMAATIKQLQAELATYKARLDICCPE